MSSSKRERQYERRRYEKWVQRQVAHRALRRKRQRILAGGLAAVLVLGLGGVGFTILTSGDEEPDAAAPTPVPSASATSDALPARTGNGGVVPDAAAAEARTWTGTLSLGQGDVGLELDGAAAPQAVANFVTLAREGYFDGTKCHRLVTSGIFVLQCGDPTATGTGGPGYTWGPIENAPADGVYPAGTIAMARVGEDGSSMGSQFFLVYEDSPIPSDGAGGYTVFGRITSGLDVVQAIADGGVEADGMTPTSDVIIEGVETQ